MIALREGFERPGFEAAHYVALGCPFVMYLTLLLLDTPARGTDNHSLTSHTYELCHRLRTPEGGTLTAVDLHVLRAQLHLPNTEMVNLQDSQKTRSKNPDDSV